MLDPTKLCNYVSEVLDAGLLGPLFKVRIFGFASTFALLISCFGGCISCVLFK